MDWNEGPLLVLAGPGSGKTAVLTWRVARLLEEDENAAVLALTFTNKAAAEMRERVDAILGKHTDRARLCTFHKFAADTLGQHGSHLGIRPDFRFLARDEDRVGILEEVIRDLPGGGLGQPPDPISLLHLIDRLFSESYSGAGPSSFLAATTCSSWPMTTSSSTSGTGPVPSGFGTSAATTARGSFNCPKAIAALPRSWNPPTGSSPTTPG